MRFKLLGIIILVTITLIPSQPRQLNVYQHGGAIDSVPGSDFDSLTVSDGTNLRIHTTGGGGVRSFAISQIDSLKFPFVGGPAVTVLSPNGGETYHVGDSLTISWRINPTAVGSYADKVAVFILLDNGQTSRQIALGLSEPQVANTDPRYNGGREITCKWKIANPMTGVYPSDAASPISTTCKILVGVYGFTQEAELSDMSNGNFTIAQ